MDLNLCGNGKKKNTKTSICPEFHSLLRNMRFICACILHVLTQRKIRMFWKTKNKSRSMSPNADKLLQSIKFFPILIHNETSYITKEQLMMSWKEIYL